MYMHGTRVGKRYPYPGSYIYIETHPSKRMMPPKFLLLLWLSPLALAVQDVAGLNSQDTCVGCTIVMALASEGAVADLEKAALRLCKNETACKVLVTGLVKLAETGASPD